MADLNRVIRAAAVSSLCFRGVEYPADRLDGEKSKTLAECWEAMRARFDESEARYLLWLWGVSDEVADREIARAKAVIAREAVDLQET